MEKTNEKASLDIRLDELRRGCEEILPEDGLRDKLEQAEWERRPLRVKTGFDPTAPDLHLGHLVLLQKMRQFQQAGHTVYFLIGDFTGRIGDPSGRDATRPPLTAEEIRANADTYAQQIFKVLNPEKTQVVFNSTWMEPMSSADLIRLASSYTVARMLEREDFHARYTAGRSIAIHEFLYPLIQGYDSVVLETDIELGGTDQKFNLLVGRELQRHYGQPQQLIMTLPILEGTDGVQKMSKSLDNYIGINEPAKEIFGKIMSISDELMWRYYELLSECSLETIEHLRQEQAAGRNPRDIKADLARELTTRFAGVEQAERAEQAFEDQFKHGQAPSDIPEVELRAEEIEGLQISRLLKATELTQSSSEARRLIRQQAVRVNGERIQEDIILPPNAGYLLQVGKRRYLRVRISLAS